MKTATFDDFPAIFCIKAPSIEALSHAANRTCCFYRNSLLCFSLPPTYLAIDHNTQPLSETQDGICQPCYSSPPQGFSVCQLSHSTTLANLNSDFGGRVVDIAVGPEHEEFSIHANRLAKTSFFEIHGFPKAAPHLRIKIPQTATAMQIDQDVKDENDGIGEGSETIQATGGHDDAQTETSLFKMVDYLLSPKDTAAPKAFRIFVEALYNEEPGEIADRDILKTSLKAYSYARTYKAFVLQNRIVERFRQHYLTHKVKMDELMWMLKIFGDDADATPLTRYLFEQIAHDISTRGFNAFSEDNGYLKFYLVEGNRNARLALFAILARHANDRRHPDPAEGRNEWRVLETGPTAGEWVAEPFNIH